LILRPASDSAQFVVRPVVVNRFLTSDLDPWITQKRLASISSLKVLIWRGQLDRTALCEQSIWQNPCQTQPSNNVSRNSFPAKL